MRRASKESLQGSGLDASLAKLARGAGGWGKALDLITPAIRRRSRMTESVVVLPEPANPWMP